MTRVGASFELAPCDGRAHRRGDDPPKQGVANAEHGQAECDGDAKRGVEHELREQKAADAPPRFVHCPGRDGEVALSGETNLSDRAVQRFLLAGDANDFNLD